MRFEPRGVIPPVITPLTPDGHVDVPAVGRLVQHLAARGVDGLFVLGSCGEGPTLPRAERIAAVRAFADAARDRLPILVGVPDTSTPRVLEAASDAEAAGADALAVMTPCYFLDPDERYVEAHVRAVVAATRLPVMLYNIPQLTGNRFTPSLVRELGALPNVVGIKDSSGDWPAFETVLEAANSVGIAVLQGAESLIARSVLAGAAGAIPGIANLVPRLACDLVAAARAGDETRALALQARLDRACEVYGAGFWLAGLKGALSTLGLCGPTCVAPVRPLDPAELQGVQAVVASLGLTDSVETTQGPVEVAR